MAVTIDDKSLRSGMARYKDGVIASVEKAIFDVASEVMRLSSFEVPHDTGALQTSGHVEHGKMEATVGYNKVYAAKLHEHPEYRFQKGRKGKYLEDPIKNNLTVFRQYVVSRLNGFIGR